jgi:hypothetical protein
MHSTPRRKLHLYYLSAIMFIVNIFLYLLFELLGKILDALDCWFCFDMILLLWDCICLASCIYRFIIFLWIQWEIFRFKLVTENSGSTSPFFLNFVLWFQPLCVLTQCSVVGYLVAACVSPMETCVPLFYLGGVDLSATSIKRRSNT